MMKKSAARVTELSKNIKSLKRTAAYLNKVVELQTVTYEPKIRKPRVFILGDFIVIPDKIDTENKMEVIVDDKPVEAKIETQIMDTTEIAPASTNDGGSN